MPVRHTATATVALILLCVLPPPAIAAQSPGWLGTWHLDVEQSTYAGGRAPYKRGAWEIVQDGDRIKMVYDLVGVRGGITHMEWTGRFDGSPYALQGPDANVAYAYTQVDANTLALDVTVDGVPNVRGRVVLGVDGRTITATTSSRNASGELVTTMTVYEKR